MHPKKSGRQPLTADHYEAEIRALYPAVQLLKAYCEANPEDTESLKELEKKKDKLRYNRDKWAERKDKIVYVANNEGLPNSEKELGCKTEPMKPYHAKKWPYKQAGDYQAYVEGVGWYYVCRERKTLEDLYGTLMDRDHWKNLCEEFERFKEDPRFKTWGIFRFDLECTEKEFYKYLPHWPKTCKFCEVKRQKMDSGEYFCPRSLNILEYDPGPDFKCHAGFNERERDETTLKSIRTMKEKRIRQCFEMGMQVVWRGSREAAYEAYRPGIEEWLKLNYVKLLKLDEAPYNDRVALENKIAECEVVLFTLKFSLEQIKNNLEEVEA